MGESNSIIEALKLVFMGLGVVFLLLIVLVYVLKLQNRVANLFCKLESNESGTSYNQSEEQISISSTESIDEKQLTAAIAAALQHHDNSNKQIAAAITAAILHHNNKGE
jgi:oxaloacetate decarboxylase gamma subunit